MEPLKATAGWQSYIPAADGLFRLAMAIERGAAEGDLVTLTTAVTA